MKLSDATEHSPLLDFGGAVDEEPPNNLIVVAIGTTATTHMPHGLCRVLAGRSRSQPVPSPTKRLL